MRQILRSAVNWKRLDKGNVISRLHGDPAERKVRAVAAAGETSFRDHADSSGEAWKAEDRRIMMASWNRFPPGTRNELEGRVERRGWARNPESGAFATSEAAVSSAPKAAQLRWTPSIRLGRHPQSSFCPRILR